MKFGIIGYGKIAKKFVESITYTKEGSVYAIASRSLKQKDTYLHQNPDVIIYHDYDLLLEDKNVEAVYIALPHAMHKEWIIKALKKNIAVLCEKPAVLTTNDMQEIIDGSLKCKTYFLEAFKTKFNLGFQHLQKDLLSIGKIKRIYVNFCSDALSLKNSNSYLFNPRQGGALNDIGTYLIGFVLAVNPTSIKEINSKANCFDGVDYYFKTIISFENDVIAEMEGAIDRNKERYATIEGELGTIYIPVFNRIINYTITLKNQKVLERRFPIDGDDMTLEIQSFIDDVKQGKISSSIHSLEDSYQIIQVMEETRRQWNY